MIALQEWAHSLTIQQQSVLMLALRGPDGVEKFNPCKHVLRRYRAAVLVAAKYGRVLRYDERGDNFMSLVNFESDEHWFFEVMQPYFSVVDQIPHHSHLHLMHGCEIVGYKHPNELVRRRFNDFYVQCCNDMHIFPETVEVMDMRLSDWDHEYWDEPVQEPAQARV